MGFQKRFILLFTILPFWAIFSNAQPINFTWGDSCISSSFYGKINSPELSQFTRVLTCSNGDIVAVGSLRDAAAPEVKVYGLVIRYTAAGALKWSKFIGITDVGINNDTRIYCATNCNNGDIVLVAQLVAGPANSGNIVMRLSENGNLIWRKKLPEVASNSVYEDVIETSDGGFLIGGVALTIGLLNKINAAGEMVWLSRTISNAFSNIRTVVETPSGYYFSGTCFLSNLNGYQNYLGKVDPANGDVLWLKYYYYPNTPNGEYGFDKMYFNNGKITLTGSTAANYSGSNRSVQAILELDELGQVLSSKRIENLSVEMDRASLFRGTMYDVKSLSGVHFQNTDTSDVYVYRLNTNNTIRWAWRIPFPDKQIPADIQSMADSSLVIACTNTNISSAYASILKTSTQGKVELCTNLNNSITLQNELPTAVDLFLNESNETNLVTIATASTILDGYGFSWQLMCAENNTYKLSKIHGNNLVCAGSTQTYITKRFGNHTTIVNFSCNIPATINRLSDTSIAVQFLQSGNAILYATMAAPCKTLRDSLVIQINSIGSSINLGADTSICFRNTRQLKVPKGFISYQWQDGSMDSTFLVNTPGQYHVSVVDACGNTFKDTIVISAAYMLPFDIGNDRTTCNIDTIQIKANTGFTQYQWLPNYAIVQNNNNQIVVQPSRDTAYTVSASQYPGCTVYDTLHVTVKFSPAILNFPDSTICTGTAITVQANPGFQQYSWNNGKDSATITIQQAGQYIVTGKYINGCLSKDTLLILSKQCFEGISFPTAFTPNNDGLNDLYKPISFEAIQYFQLTLYNRWGNKVFETNDIQKGWDGKMNGIEQNTGSYSFICTYQFMGKPLLKNNGTIFLIR